MGAKLLQDVAHQTNELVGDGTTTSIVLARSMFKEGMVKIEQGLNVALVRRGMHLACKKIVKELKK